MNSNTIGENIIDALKMHFFGALSILKFSAYCQGNIGLFSIAPCEVTAFPFLIFGKRLISLILFFFSFNSYRSEGDSNNFFYFSLLLLLACKSNSYVVQKK